MRVVDPKNFKHQKRKHTKLPHLLFVTMLIAVGYYFLIYSTDNQTIETSHSNIIQDQPQKTAQNTQNDPYEPYEKTNELRIFTDNEFKVFYDQLLQPNLERVENPPEISGNEIADARIRELAEQRGYRLRSSPSITLSSTGGHLLQPAVIEPWQNLKAAAASDGHQISIVSGYRTVDRQRMLFLSRLAATGVTIDQVAAGLGDEQVDLVLQTSSIPGYSKHHTGYTIDLLCAGFGFENFKNSTCNDWITQDNYKVAKENGFIPSYPPLAETQGPDPEAWEYVWVGTDLMYE